MLKCEKIKDYQEYKNIQIKRSASKWFATTFNERLFYKILFTAFPKMWVTSTGKCLRPERICCMGIRNGNEYEALKKVRYILTEINDSEIHGVDINPLVPEVGEHCYCYDFSELPKDWENKFHLIYSNSLDHSFNLEKTISEWWRISQNDRFILLTLPSCGKTCATDIYDFKEEDCKKIFDEKRFEIRHIWREYQQEKTFNVLIRVKK